MMDVACWMRHALDRTREQVSEQEVLTCRLLHVRADEATENLLLHCICSPLVLLLSCFVEGTTRCFTIHPTSATPRQTNEMRANGANNVSFHPALASPFVSRLRRGFTGASSARRERCATSKGQGRATRYSVKPSTLGAEPCESERESGRKRSVLCSTPLRSRTNRKYHLQVL